MVTSCMELHRLHETGIATGRKPHEEGLIPAAEMKTGQPV